MRVAGICWEAAARWTKSTPIGQANPSAERAVVATASLFGGIVLLALASGWMAYDGTDLNVLFMIPAGCWTLGQVQRASGLRASAEPYVLIALFVLLVLLAPLASAVLALSAFPLADARLARIDTVLVPGFDWAATARLLERHAIAMRILSDAYVSLGWQPPLLLVTLCLAGRARAAWSFLAAWSAALVGVMALFPLLPALGAYTFYAIPRAAMASVLCGSAWHYPHTLLALRAGTIATLSAATLDGIVAMPSFHAASAVLLAWGFSKLAWLRWPFVALNILMWLSAIPIGGHYLIDVAAGSTLAVGAILWAERRDARASGERQVEREPRARAVIV